MLRTTIASGDVATATPLNPAVLASQFGVSQTPVREALIELARDGFLDAPPNRGFTLRPHTSAEARELYPLMWDLEATALYSAPPTPTQLDELVRINTELAAATESLDQLSLDAAWHEELVRGCLNRTLVEIMDTLRWRIRRYEAPYAKQARISPQSAVQHHATVLALRRHDIDRAAQLLELKWQQAMDLVVAWLATKAPD